MPLVEACQSQFYVLPLEFKDVPIFLSECEHEP